MPRRPSAIAENTRLLQISALREFTAKFGALHEAQVLQLKIWPKLAFDYAKKHETKVNLEKRIVDVHLVAAKRPKNFVPRANGFCESVRWLLGQEWMIRIYENKSLIFTADREIAVPESKYQGTDFEAGKVVPQPWQFQKKPPSSKA
jgi:hypothetical protein